MYQPRTFRQSQRFQIQGWEDTRTDEEIEAEEAPAAPSYWLQVKQARIARIGIDAYIAEQRASNEQLRAVIIAARDRARAKAAGA